MTSFLKCDGCGMQTSPIPSHPWASLDLCQATGPQAGTGFSLCFHLCPGCQLEVVTALRRASFKIVNSGPLEDVGK